MMDKSGLSESVLNGLDEMDLLQFDFTEDDRGDFVVLSPKGYLNNATVKYIKDRLYYLCNEEGCKVVMSLKDVDLIDSVGLGVMITAHKNSEKYGGMLVFSDLNDMIFKNMKLLHMDRYLHIRPDINSAASLFDW